MISFIKGTIRDIYSDCYIGFSDHSEGNEISLASLGIGVDVIERHFTLDKSSWGPDHKASMNPKEFEKFVSKIRKAEKSLGNYDWDIQDSEIIQKETICLVDIPSMIVRYINS